ncbi:MAG TPA: YggT family protein [Actinomycetales bacterium]|nr:YggT family protein [Actinomycetales bacterium]
MILLEILRWVVLAFLLVLIGRLVLDWIQVFARDWRPKGPILVVAEVVYTVTDPPLKLLRRLIPPLRLGSVQLDLAFFILFLLTYVLLNVLQRL